MLEVSGVIIQVMFELLLLIVNPAVLHSVIDRVMSALVMGLQITVGITSPPSSTLEMKFIHHKFIVINSAVASW